MGPLDHNHRILSRARRNGSSSHCSVACMGGRRMRQQRFYPCRGTPKALADARGECKRSARREHRKGRARVRRNRGLRQPRSQPSSRLLGGVGGGGRGPVVGTMRGGCLLAVGARRAQGSNKFSSVQLSSLLQYPPPLFTVTDLHVAQRDPGRPGRATTHTCAGAGPAAAAGRAGNARKQACGPLCGQSESRQYLLVTADQRDCA